MFCVCRCFKKIPRARVVKSHLRWGVSNGNTPPLYRGVKIGNRERRVSRGLKRSHLFLGTHLAGKALIPRSYWAYSVLRQMAFPPGTR